MNYFITNTQTDNTFTDNYNPENGQIVQGYLLSAIRYTNLPNLERGNAAKVAGENPPK